MPSPRYKCTLLSLALLISGLSMYAQRNSIQYNYYKTIIGRIDPYTDINYYRLSNGSSKSFMHVYRADQHLMDSNALIFERRPSRLLIEYSKQNDNEWQLYSQIKNNIPIGTSMIDTLYLDSLAERQGDNWVIPYQLHFENAYIQYIKFPGEELPDKLPHTSNRNYPKTLFQKPVTFKQCTFTNVYFRNIIFNDDVTFLNNFTFGRFSNGVVFDNTSFNRRSRIINDYISQITYFPLADDQRITQIGNKVFTWAEKVFSNFFSDPFTGLRTQPAYKATPNCIFYDEAVIYNNNPYYSLDFSGVTFKGRTYITTFFRDQSRLKYNDSQAEDTPEIDLAPASNMKFPICNMSFNSANFSHMTSFNNQYVNNIDLKDAFFSDTLMLFNTIIKDSLKTNNSFYYSHLSSGLNIILNPSNFNLSNFNINPVSIGELNFMYCQTNSAISMRSKAFLENVNSFYDKLIDDIKFTYSRNQDLVNELENKYRHQQLGFKVVYLWHNPSIKNLLELYWISFLELAVRNGYKGGGNFLMSCFFIITLFTLLYYFLFRKTFIAYIDTENEEKKESANKSKKRKKSPYDPKDYIKNFLKCFWKSFYIFFDYKFSKTYFSFPNPLLIVVIMEWLMGVFMIVIFLIYVAANYPFIRNLLGL
ncbi:pentapeptide repeat-containing protein [Chitinophaga sp. HK235]|uniref:pentapeptide repeat-containing protein n=1 Tax=Chitinophaga sp. HK235 TaxID=2952571 RepID=UPI001BAB6E68|nr:pentapeptide repeat-containing protein [Chitinophaga sp. HK235]